jgi:hypothetical protein
VGHTRRCTHGRILSCPRDIKLVRSDGSQSRVRFRLGRLSRPEGMGRACCRGACCFIFVSWIHRASSCWYFCWYPQRLTDKMNLNSDGYGNRRLPARGTILRCCAASAGQAKSRSILAKLRRLPRRSFSEGGITRHHLHAKFEFQTARRSSLRAPAKQSVEPQTRSHGLRRRKRSSQ